MSNFRDRERNFSFYSRFFSRERDSCQCLVLSKGTRSSMTTQSQDFSIIPEKYLYRYINFLNLFKKCVNVCSDKIRQNNCPTDGRRWGLFQGYLFNPQLTLLAWMANCIGAENEPDCEGCHCQWDLVILSRYTDTNTECGGICPRPMAALLCTAYIYIICCICYICALCPVGAVIISWVNAAAWPEQERTTQTESD